MARLAVTPYMTLEQPSEGVLVYRRTPLPYPDEAALRDSFKALFSVLDTMHTQEMGLVVDVRAAQGRNDDAFEAAHAPVRERLFTSFRAVALVVGTVVGKLQVSRFLRGVAVDSHVFFDEGEAEAWLEATLAGPSES